MDCKAYCALTVRTPVVILDGFGLRWTRWTPAVLSSHVILSFFLLEKSGFAGPESLFCNTVVNSWWEKQVDIEPYISGGGTSFTGLEQLIRLWVKSASLLAWQGIKHTSRDWKFCLWCSIMCVFLPLSPWASWIWIEQLFNQLLLFSPNSALVIPDILSNYFTYMYIRSYKYLQLKGKEIMNVVKIISLTVSYILKH